MPPSGELIEGVDSPAKVSIGSYMLKPGSGRDLAHKFTFGYRTVAQVIEKSKGAVNGKHIPVETYHV